MIGRRFHRLVVVSKAEPEKQRTRWNCVCDCGKDHIVKSKYLLNGEVKSCGCLKYDATANQTHGMSNSPIYHVWFQMKQRCNNVNNTDYFLYGGRGITVCDRWSKSFENFFEDMAPGYSKGLSLDRINNDKDYSPENCQWATLETQANNRRNNAVIVMDGVSKTMAQWSRHLGINYSTIRNRWRVGLTPEKILCKKVR